MTELAGIDVAAVIEVGALGAGVLDADAAALMADPLAVAAPADPLAVADPMGTFDVSTSDAGGLAVAFASGAVMRTKSV